LVLFCLAQVYGEVYFAPVEVQGWTTTGERIEKIWAILTPLGGGRKFTGTGHVVKLSVPTGEYILQVEAPGFETRRQVLWVYQPGVFRSVALPVGHMDFTAASGLRGTVHNYDGKLRSLRIMLVELYGSEVSESLVDAHGLVQLFCG
jgi:hypothetical protein